MQGKHARRKARYVELLDMLFDLSPATGPRLAKMSDLIQGLDGLQAIDARDTLFRYLETGGRPGRAAQQLQTSPRTVRRRLRAIEEASDLDLSWGPDMLIAALTLAAIAAPPG